MRVRRRRRRILAAVLASIYLGAFAWLVSPLWGSADAPTSEDVPVREVSAKGLVGVDSLGASKALPESLPGSSATVVTAAESGEEAVTETGTEVTAGLPEGGESSTSPPASPEPSQQSQETIVSSEG
jgi:hypothetical protein